MLQLPESKFIVNLLTRDLATDLYYHTVGHTLDVYDRSKAIGEKENISETDMKLLLVAALYHDAGYLYQRDAHEKRSCEIVESVLPGFGYSQPDIERICQIIMATKLPQEPQSLLEEIICDADLDYLGRDDFFEIGNRLYLEMHAVGRIANEYDWNNIQIEFLQKHRYFTTTSQQLRSQRKEKNLQVLLSNNQLKK